jgi:hypothetical protein
LKGRAFYWRTLSRSNGSFLSIGSDLARKFASAQWAELYFSKAACVGYDAEPLLVE